MSRTAKLREQIEALGLEDPSIVERIVGQADHFLSASQSFVEQGQQVEMCFFLIPREGDISMFMPSVSMIGLPKMNVQQEKDVVASAVRQLASESKAIAVIHIAEAWGLSLQREDITQDDIDFVQRNGVAAHPKAVEMVHCQVSLNCRGQGNEFVAAYQIEGEKDNRTMTEHTPWTRTRAQGQGGRFNIEAHYLEPLT
tara:strand:+ start:160016 stop:160609 length:594 start_codon:yes stop_codon:yes gene_type:complete